MLIVSRDIDAKAEDQNWDYERVISKYGLAERNDNGEWLSEMCNMNELAKAGTSFPCKTIHEQCEFLWTTCRLWLIIKRFTYSVKDTELKVCRHRK